MPIFVDIEYYDGICKKNYEIILKKYLGGGVRLILSLNHLNFGYIHIYDKHACNKITEYRVLI